MGHLILTDLFLEQEVDLSDELWRGHHTLVFTITIATRGKRI